MARSCRVQCGVASRGKPGFGVNSAMQSDKTSHAFAPSAFGLGLTLDIGDPCSMAHGSPQAMTNRTCPWKIHTQVGARARARARRGGGGGGGVTKNVRHEMSAPMKIPMGMRNIFATLQPQNNSGICRAQERCDLADSQRSVLPAYRFVPWPLSGLIFSVL